MAIIAVIDGMGGGIGVQIVTQLRQELPLDVEILALGANAVAKAYQIRNNVCLFAAKPSPDLTAHRSSGMLRT